MGIDWQALLSSVLGGSLVLSVAKYFLAQTFNRIDKLPSQIAKMDLQLSVINVKFEAVDRLQSVSHDHEKRISGLQSSVAVLESTRASNRRSQSNCQA